MFSFNSMIRGYHKYMMIWSNPIAGEELTCSRELGNSRDPYAIAVKKMIGREEKVVGHVPRRISAICSLFIRRGGNIRCQVTRFRARFPDFVHVPTIKNLEGKTLANSTLIRQIRQSFPPPKFSTIR